MTKKGVLLFFSFPHLRLSWNPSRRTKRKSKKLFSLSLQAFKDFSPFRSLPPSLLVSLSLSLSSSLAFLSLSLLHYYLSLALTHTSFSLTHTNTSVFLSLFLSSLFLCNYISLTFFLPHFNSLAWWRKLSIETDSKFYEIWGSYFIGFEPMTFLVRWFERPGNSVPFSISSSSQLGMVDVQGLLSWAPGNWNWDFQASLNDLGPGS